MISKKRIPIIIDEKSNPIQLWNEIKNELIKCNIKNFYKLYNSKGKEIKLNYQNENGNTLLIFSAIYNLEEICFFYLEKELILIYKIFLGILLYIMQFLINFLN